MLWPTGACNCSLRIRTSVTTTGTESFCQDCAGILSYQGPWANGFRVEGPTKGQLIVEHKREQRAMVRALRGQKHVRRLDVAMSEARSQRMRRPHAKGQGCR